MLFRLLTRCTGATCRAKRRPVCSASKDRGLRVGVVGLGAIGSIFFAQLSQLLVDQPKGNIPLLSIDAFVKQEQLCKLTNKPQIVLQNSVGGMPVLTNISLTIGDYGTLVNADDSFTSRVLTLEQANKLITDEKDRIDVVLITLKAYDSAQAIEELYTHYKHLFATDAVFILLQNGLGTGQHVSGDHWQFAHGITFVGGRVQTLGNVAVSGLSTGITYLAPTTSKTSIPKLKALGSALSASGFKLELLDHDQMKTILWRKLIVNASINPIASILNATNQRVGACEWSRSCVSAIVHEAYAVAKGDNVELGCSVEELINNVLEVAQNTGNNVCSMLSDLQKGSQTEIDAITGEIITRGDQLKIPTPVNTFVFNLIKSLSQK